MSNTARGIQYPVGSDPGTLATHFSNLATTADAAIAFDAGYKNIFINGGFDIWQRGASHSTSGSIAADRWPVYTSVDTFNASRIVLGAGAYLPVGFKYGYTISNTNGGTTGSYTSLQQLIEGVHTCNGLTVTVSFWAMANSGAPTIGLSFDQVFGTTGGTTTVNGASFGNPTLTSSWARYSYTTTVPALPSYFTLGSNGNDYLGFNMWLSAGSTHATRSGNLTNQNVDISLAGLQMEVGPAVTAFERRPVAAELALCQRYYERQNYPGSDNAVAGGVCWSTNGAYHAVTCVTKRRIPTVTYAGTWEAVIGAYVRPGSLTISDASVTSAQVVLVPTSNDCIVGHGSLLRTGVGGNNYIAFDAELPT